MKNLITPYASNIGTPNVIIRHFPDTESYVQIPQIKSLKNKKVTIYHSLYPEQDKRIFELLLILSLVRKQTKHIELFASGQRDRRPYGYWQFFLAAGVPCLHPRRAVKVAYLKAPDAGKYH